MSAETPVNREDATREVVALLATYTAHRPSLVQMIVAAQLLESTFGPYPTIRRMVLDQLLIVLREDLLGSPPLH
jgi:hypothetical protein